jgi:hypothetical protein
MSSAEAPAGAGAPPPTDAAVEGLAVAVATTHVADAPGDKEAGSVREYLGGLRTLGASAGANGCLDDRPLGRRCCAAPCADTPAASATLLIV